MSSDRTFTFVVAVNNRDVLTRNVLASPCLQNQSPHQLMLRENFSSASCAYNSALMLAANETIIFAHQDMFFPEGWIRDLNRSLDILDAEDPDWGVLGCYGVTQDNKGYGYLYSPGQGFLGKPFVRPIPVQTLDEIVLIIRKSSALKFGETLTDFHLYGPDICLAAQKRGMRSYAISAFCIHNAQLNLILPATFYASYKEFKKTWKSELPVQTTCIRITKFDIPMRVRQLRETYLRLARKQYGITRVQDPKELLKDVGAGMAETTFLTT